MRQFEDADLRELAELESGERAFVSCYLCPPTARDWLERRVKQVENFLADEPDDLEHFHDGMRLIEAWLEENKPEKDAPAICVFACFGLDFIRGYALPVEVPPLLRLGPAPLIRPLAEIEDEHEDFVFVTADNEEAEIHLVSTTMIRQRERIKGDIKNHVKKGGWSQKRYQRRRQNELLHYAKEVVAQLEELYKQRKFPRLVLLGSKEAREAILEHLSRELEEVLVGESAANLNTDEDALLKAAHEYTVKAERREERSLWDRIKAEYLGNGLAATGVEAVWHALANGRADEIIVDRKLKLRGYKCRKCENITPQDEDRACAYCSSDEVFRIDLLDEIVRQAERTSARVDFADSIRGVTKAGGIAALLRY